MKKNRTFTRQIQPIDKCSALWEESRKPFVVDRVLIDGREKRQINVNRCVSEFAENGKPQ